MSVFFTRLRGIVPSAIVAAMWVASLSGCDDKVSAFIGGRVEEQCNQSWPVCDLIAGCILGNETYTTGRFPGTKRVIIRLAEASQVTTSFILEDVTAAGTQLTITFYESGCTDRTRVQMTGETAVQENETVGYIARSSNLVGLGDHRLEFNADLQARYHFKVDVTPLRLVGGGGL